MSLFDSVILDSIEPSGKPDLLAFILCGFASVFAPELWEYSFMLKIAFPFSSVVLSETLIKSLSNASTRDPETGTELFKTSIVSYQ